MITCPLCKELVVDMGLQCLPRGSSIYLEDDDTCDFDCPTTVDMGHGIHSRHYYRRTLQPGRWISRFRKPH